MKRILMVAAMFVAALSSCSKNEISEGSVMLSSSDAVSFSVYSSGTVASKGAVTQASNVGSIGIVAYEQGDSKSWGSSGGYTPADALPNFINSSISGNTNQGTWSFPDGETYYWESNETETYSFFAYGPYGKVGTGLDMQLGTSVGNAPTITYTVNTTQANMVDFVAGQEMDIYKTGTTTSGSTAGDVNLNLKHQLTRVTFSAISGAEITDKNTYINVTGLKLISGTTDKLYGKGVYTFDVVSTDTDKNVHTQDGSWDFNGQSLLQGSGESSGTFAMDLNDVAFNHTGVTYNTSGVSVGTDAMLGTPTTSSNPKVSLFAADDYLFLLPPAALTGLSGAATSTLNSGTAAATIQVEVSYDIITVSSGLAGGAGVKYNNKVTVDLTTGTLRQGYAYEFVLTISSDENPTGGQGQPDDPSFNKVTISANILDWDLAVSAQNSSGSVDQDTNSSGQNDATIGSGSDLEWKL